MYEQEIHLQTVLFGEVEEVGVVVGVEEVGQEGPAVVERPGYWRASHVLSILIFPCQNY